ncbi:hypothetical protein PVAP13_2KG374700 [Panicum virgatum]|uniref:Uncharacterized protein n=1 Tax=Panicum virgatum TaxID=38727 RepID=A0A8T0WH61_PANVG|nr:hypothetical protein PVAP13_2KG374700 [Panicum virgatum]
MSRRRWEPATAAARGGAPPAAGSRACPPREIPQHPRPANARFRTHVLRRELNLGEEVELRRGSHARPFASSGKWAPLCRGRRAEWEPRRAGQLRRQPAPCWAPPPPMPPCAHAPLCRCRSPGPLRPGWGATGRCGREEKEKIKLTCGSHLIVDIK